MPEVHRTAIFTLHDPTRHTVAVLERAFRAYTHAYTTLLHVVEQRFDVDALRGLAIYRLDEKHGGRPRMNARTLTHCLMTREDLPPAVGEVLAHLESRLRQSVWEHVGQTLMSYVALSDAYAEAHPDGDEGARDDHEPRHSRDVGGPPAFPSRLRALDLEPTRRHTLARLVASADDETGERALVANLLRTRQAEVVAIPFVGVAAAYGCGLYYQEANRRFYARLDIVPSNSRLGRPISARGRYRDLKSGETAVAGAVPADEPALTSFGRGKKSVLVPLEIGRWHETAQRFTATALLPQRGVDATHPAAARPVTAKLVRRRRATGEVRYQFHVTFALEVPEAGSDGLTEEARPLLAINRGIAHLFSAVLTAPDASRTVEYVEASGAELRAAQEAIECVRAARMRRGTATATGARIGPRDRRQARIAEEQVNLCANQIVEMAARHRAQVVFEDLSAFASGAAVRAVDAKPAARRRGVRTILNRRQFQAVQDAVNQRLALVGLPSARMVSAAHISVTCPDCGVRDAENRERDDGRGFRCVRCGYAEDIDMVAAYNIARKLAWLRARGREKRARITSDMRQSWDAFSLATAWRFARG